MKSAVCASSPSPIDSGTRVGLAPIVPDSYTRISSGLWTIRARIAAVLGRPTPMNTVLVSISRRAATTVWTSPAVAVVSVTTVIAVPPP